MQILRTLRTATTYHDTTDGERSHVTKTPYRRYHREPYHFRHHAKGRHARAIWMRRGGLIEHRDGSLSLIDAA